MRNDATRYGGWRGCVVDVPDTGGRCDFFFFVDLNDMPKFAVQRFQFGMRWWQDVYYNEGEGIYPIEFRVAYPPSQ